jgi:hypothetical protein
LLTFTEVRDVQKVALKDTKASERNARGQRHSTCVFTTEDFAHSVSVTLTTSTDRPDTLTEYWARTFSRDRTDDAREKGHATPKRTDPPLRRIGGLGNDAVWTGDAKAGSLYVFVPGAILRVSVGGVADVPERLRRSQELAAIALARLHSGRTARKPASNQ